MVVGEADLLFTCKCTLHRTCCKNKGIHYKNVQMFLNKGENMQLYMEITVGTLK